MKSSFKTYIVLVITLLSCATPLFAQEKDKSGIDAGQVNVIQEYRPVIADAIKLGNQPVLDDSIPPPVKMNYTVLPKWIETQYTPDLISPAKMRGEPLARLYPFSARVGFGGYITPFAEFSASTLRNKKWNGSFYGRHFSSSGDIANSNYAGFNDNDFRATGNFFLKDHVIKTQANYYHHKVNFYGGENLSDTANYNIKGAQHYSLIESKARIEGIKDNKNRIFQEGGVRFYHLGARNNINEASFGADATMAKFLNNEWVGGTVAIDYFGNKNSPDSSEAAILKFNPFFQTTRNRFQARAGLKIMVETELGLTHFFPDIFVKYNLVEDVFSVYGQAQGNTARNSFRTLSETNPFVNPAIAFRNTNTLLDAAVGLRGNISSAVFFDVSGFFKIIDSAAMFVNYPKIVDETQNSFRVIYESMQVAGVKGSLGYRATDKFLLNLSGAYNRFFLETQDKAWHMPELELGLNGRYYLGDKIVLRADIIYIGKRYAFRDNDLLQDDGSFIREREIIELKGIADFNLGVDYRYSNRFGAFVQFNNIAAQRFMQWNNYQLQRFNFMGGLTFNF
jgi:hypothetical protein